MALDGVQNAHELQMVEFGQVAAVTGGVSRYRQPLFIGMNNIEDAIQTNLVSQLTPSPFFESSLQLTLFAPPYTTSSLPV